MRHISGSCYLTSYGAIWGKYRQQQIHKKLNDSKFSRGLETKHCLWFDSKHQLYVGKQYAPEKIKENVLYVLLPIWSNTPKKFNLMNKPVLKTPKTTRETNILFSRPQCPFGYTARIVKHAQTKFPPILQRFQQGVRPLYDYYSVPLHCYPTFCDWNSCRVCSVAIGIVISTKQFCLIFPALQTWKVYFASLSPCWSCWIFRSEPGADCPIVPFSFKKLSPPHFLVPPQQMNNEYHQLPWFNFLFSFKIVTIIMSCFKPRYFFMYGIKIHVSPCS